MTLPDRDGRTITITPTRPRRPSRPAPSADFSTAVVRGHVKLRTSDDLIVTCNEGTFNDKTGMLDVPGPVTFTRGRMTGTGTGATYDRNRDVLWLLADARITVDRGRDRVAERCRRPRAPPGWPAPITTSGSRRAPTSSPTTGPSTPTT